MSPLVALLAPVPGPVLPDGLQEGPVLALRQEEDHDGAGHRQATQDEEGGPRVVFGLGDWRHYQITREN